ncbi:MAG: hypothetical protein IT431_04805 [Phycisphaerales bacterium]|nr:hypothetical protein [Phycisphaerales bacterium]
MKKHSIVSCGALVVAIAAGAASAQWADDFDSYPVGPLNSGGWDGWDGVPAAYGVVTTDQAHSGPNSLAAGGGTDAVYQFSGLTSGQWALSGWVYVPSNIDAETYWIVQNEYAHGGPYDWTVEIHLDVASGLVWEAIQDGFGNGSNYVNLVTDGWAEVRAEFDLDANVVTTYYNGELLASGPVDTYQGGAIAIANLDLYGPQAVAAYHDDISLVDMNGDPCLDGIANCNGDDLVNTQDFLCYLGKWSASDPSADCNGDNIINTQDFLCYLGEWSACRS